MDDLIAFLRAQLDKAEAMARATTPVLSPGQWIVTRDKHAEDDAPLALVQGKDESAGDAIFHEDYVSGREIIVYSAGWQDEAEANLRYIAANDPASVLADVAAKRQIIEWLAAELDLPNEPGQGLAAALSDAKAIKALKILALPYADHPDYRPEWRP